ncbi:MurG UDP-N-acetylglucosamine,LPS N-acetylglucosamine transferase [Methylophilaceae bacterium]|jgi:UDP-N-acetylglucosamine--N-acetylmuramyl-(pentapeptide) pyrophosphoryl-undecaprenol N-acetylglucosamine transferase
MSKTLMIMAGGTGGHVYPAMAVADALLAQGWKVVWLCTEGGMENRLIANKPYQKAMISMRGVRGKGYLGWLLLPFKLLIALSQSALAMRQHQPDVVLGMGGFAAFPGGLMAKLLGKPLVVHEQNSVAGLTNKVLAPLANKVLAAFPAAFGAKALLLGNPVRADICAIAEPAKRAKGRRGPLRLLVVGGSLGAQALNEVLPLALAQLDKKDRPIVVHQAGEKHIVNLTQRYQQLAVDAEPKAFIDDMAAMYAWADLLICRAGALTVAELSAAGVASLLVPFPHAVDDHQTGNAHYLSDAGAALLMPQAEFTVEKVAALLQGMTREQCLDMAIKARGLGMPEATTKVATICMELAA